MRTTRYNRRSTGRRNYAGAAALFGLSLLCGWAFSAVLSGYPMGVLEEAQRMAWDVGMLLPFVLMLAAMMGSVACLDRR